MRWLDLFSLVRYLVEAVRKILAQIRAYSKKRELENEIEKRDDRYTADSIRDIL